MGPESKIRNLASYKCHTITTMIKAWLFVALFSLPTLTAQTADVKGLEHSKWRLVDLGPVKVPRDPPFTMTLEKDSFFLSGCNSVSGKLRLGSSRISFLEPARATRKACPGGLDDADSAFTKLVGATPRVRLNGNRMTLTSDGNAAWVFEREQLASINAKTRFIYVAAFTKDCTGVAPMKCLQVRESKDGPWILNYTGVIGFEHVPGIEYRLRIKEDKVEHPLAGGPSVLWFLDAVIGQTVVDRAAAEAYEAGKKH